MTAPTERARLMSTRDLCEYLAIPEATLIDWRYKRTGPPFHRIGGAVRYTRTDVDAWLKRQRISTT